MPAAVTQVAAAWLFESSRLDSADRLFDDEQHAHEGHDGQRCCGDADNDHRGNQPKRGQHTPKPWKTESPHGFTGVCGVRVHDLQQYLPRAQLHSVQRGHVSEETKYG